jgi:hypothetical protein
VKRLLLILAAVIGLVAAASAVAGKSGGTHPDQALQALVAPRHRAHLQRAACPAPTKTLPLAAAPVQYLVLAPPAALRHPDVDVDPIALRARRVHLLEPERRPAAVGIDQILGAVTVTTG